MRECQKGALFACTDPEDPVLEMQSITQALKMPEGLSDKVPPAWPGSAPPPSCTLKFEGIKVSWPRDPANMPCSSLATELVRHGVSPCKGGEVPFVIELARALAGCGDDWTAEPACML